MKEQSKELDARKAQRGENVPLYSIKAKENTLSKCSRFEKYHSENINI